MENLVSNEMLGVIFNRLRNQENIPIGKVSSLLKSESIFKVLVNAKYKQEKQIALSDLELKIKQESGDLIFMYVSEKWNSIKNNLFVSKIPFPEMSTKALSDVEKRTIKKSYSTNKFIA